MLKELQIDMGNLFLVFFRWIGLIRKPEETLPPMASAIKFGADGTIWLGGAFTAGAVGVEVDRLASYDGTGWEPTTDNDYYAMLPGGGVIEGYPGTEWTWPVCWFCGKPWSPNEYGTCEYCTGPESKERMGQCQNLMR